MKISKEKRNMIVISTLSALALIPTTLPVYKGAKLLLNKINLSDEESDDKILELMIEAALGVPISFTNLGILCEYLEKEDENKEKEKKLVK